MLFCFLSPPLLSTKIMQEALLVVILVVVICIAIVVFFGKPKSTKSNSENPQIIQALKTISENQGVLSEQLAAFRTDSVNQSPPNEIQEVDPELLLRKQMMAQPETLKIQDIDQPASAAAKPNQGKRLAMARAAKRAAQNQAPSNTGVAQ